MQYLLTQLTVALVLVGLCQFKTASLPLLGAILNFFVIVPQLAGPWPTPVPSVAQIPVKAVFMKVNSRAGDPEEVLALIRENQPDLVVLAVVTED